jgi:isopenicillin N synthase-like dioxygenase
MFDAALQLYVQHMLQLGNQLMQGIAVGLGLPRDYFAQKGAGPHNSYWCSRVIHYPPLAEGTYHRERKGGIREAAAAAATGANVDRAVQLSCGEHTDYGLLTMVNQESHVSALQVKNAQGQWVSADPIPDTFVCNIGDMLKVWTNGLYEPTAHRVVNADPSRSRVSIPFFYEPSYETVVEPAAELLQAHRMKAEYPPMRYGTHLESKVLSNFEL